MTVEFREEGLFISRLTPSTPLSPGDPLHPLQEALIRGDERLIPSEDGVLIEPELLRSLSSEQLAALGIHRPQHPLQIESVRDLRSPEYRWRVLSDGQPRENRGPWLLSEPPTLLDEDQEEVFALAARVATATTRSQRLRPLGYLQHIADRRQDIVLAPTLAKNRVQISDQLRIQLEPAPEGELPVPQLVDHTSGEPIALSESELASVSREGLLDESSKLLGSRWIVTSPGVARNAVIASIARVSPAAERRRFIENPTAYLSDDTAFDQADYAKRVTGIGEIPARVTETAPSGRDWVGTDVGLVIPDIHGGQVAVAAARVPELHAALTQAVEAGAPSAAFDGRPIPATQPLLSAVSRVLEGERPPRPPGEPEQSQRPLILLIADNEIALDWAPPPGSDRSVDSLELPRLSVPLQPHQRVALGQLQELWRAGCTGALLCDDMGLGKTLQALTFGAWAARQIRAGHRPEGDPRSVIDIPLAIVAPPGLLEGWVRELERRLSSSELPVLLWGPDDRLSQAPVRMVLKLQDFVIDGRGRAVTLEHARVDREKLAAARPDVLLISYDQLRRLQFAIGQLRIGVIVADEAHQAKDPNSLRSRALRAMNVDFALALTGTPIENSWRDLWTLCDFAVPARLGTLREFHTAYPTDGEVGEVGEKLAETLKPVMIRRTRKDILDQLPACTQTRIEAPMPEAQALLYEAERVHHQRAGGSPLALLQRLSQISLHPRQRADLKTREEAEAWAAESARTSVLWAALRRFREESAAVLVFVRSLAMQETLRAALIRSFGLPDVGVLNGEETLKRRNALVAHVEGGTGFRVLLVSPEVGGVGWNLQFATRGVLLERSWNPAKEAQMIARIHRLGQTLPVEVVTPIATLTGRSSFDIVLDELLSDKRTLSESVLAPAEISEGELAERFHSLVEASPTSQPRATPPPARPASESLPMEPTPREPPRGDTLPKELPREEHTLHPLARALADSPALQSHRAHHPAERIDRLLRAVDQLARSEAHTLPATLFASALGIPMRRLEGELAHLGSIANVDGQSLIEYDHAGGQVRLILVRLRVWSGLGYQT